MGLQIFVVTPKADSIQWQTTAPAGTAMIGCFFRAQLCKAYQGAGRRLHIDGLFAHGTCMDFSDELSLRPDYQRHEKAEAVITTFPIMDDQTSRHFALADIFALAYAQTVLWQWVKAG